MGLTDYFKVSLPMQESTDANSEDFMTMGYNDTDPSRRKRIHTRETRVNLSSRLVAIVSGPESSVPCSEPFVIASHPASSILL